MVLKTFRKINDSAVKLYFAKTEFDHDEFLYECLGHIKDYFEKILGDDFIYIAISFTNKQRLSFVGEAKKEVVFKGHKFAKKLKKSQKKELFGLLEQYIEEANDLKIISLTKILLDKEIKKDVFINFSEHPYPSTLLNDKISEIKLYSRRGYLEEIEFDRTHSKKIKLFSQEFQSSLNYESYLKYFHNYYTLGNKYKDFKGKDFLIHFIKPSILEFDYNLLLSLATSRKLSKDELALVNLLMHRIVSQTATEKVQEALRHATRAAISQVMARNMSHNIGSHVMNHLIDGKQIIELDGQIKNQNSYQGGCFDYSNTVDLNPNNQLAYFNNYIKCRMDYLSEVTFGVPNMQTTKKMHAEVFRDFDKVRLLLNNISGINDFIYQLCFKYKNYCCVDDVSVAFPSDVLGVQAFYNILENIIRNTAKHDQNKGKSTTFTIHIQDIEPKDLVGATEEIKNEAALYYKVEITDGIKKEGTTKIEEEKLTEDVEREYRKYKNIDKVNNDEWLAKRSENIEKIEWLIDSQNMKINQSVLDRSNNQLRTNSLGLLEMEASAAFLRKIDMPDIESDDYQVLSDEKIFNHKTNKFNILKAINKNGALGYRIFLSKPQEFLFVGDWQEVKLEKKVELLKYGIWFRSTMDFKKELENNIIYHHQFVLYDKASKSDILLSKVFSDEKENIDIIKLKNALPIRLLEIEDETEIVGYLNNVDGIDFNSLENIIWEKWINLINRINNLYFTSSPLRIIQDESNIILLNHNEDSDSAFENDKLKEHIKYFEPLSTIAKSRLPNYKGSLADYFQPECGFAGSLKSKIVESVISKVIVIDERIQNFSLIGYLGISNKIIFDCINVILPNSEIKLDSKNFEDIINEIEDFVEINIIDSNYLLLHYGILERMYESNKQKINLQLNYWALKTRVIVTSGRGKQSLELPTSVCYINLSSISNVFIEYRSKYSINSLLNQARK